MSNLIELSKDTPSFGDFGTERAFKIVSKAAEFLGTNKLVKISSAHTDSCLYFGESGLMFAKQLFDLGAKVSVPTTMNVGSLDLLHPELVQSNQESKKKHHNYLITMWDLVVSQFTRVRPIK